MADKAAQATDDSGQSKEADTSNADDSKVIDFDSDDLFDDIDTSDAEPIDSEEDSNDEAATESTEKSKEEPKDDVKEEEPPVEPPEKEAEEDATKPSEADERKRLSDEAAKARIEAKKAREEADNVKKQAEEANIERYLKEAADDEDELAKRQLDVQTYRLKEERIGINTERLQVGVDRALASIDLFKSGTPAVQNRLMRAIDQFEAQYIVQDDKGRPTEVRGDIYQYLQEEAASIRELLGDGARQQESKKTGQNARTVTPPVKAPAKKKSDPGLDDFDAEAARW